MPISPSALAGHQARLLIDLSTRNIFISGGSAALNAKKGPSDEKINALLFMSSSTPGMGP